jgi:hypothetical protein
LSKEVIILLITWIVTTAMLMVFVPRGKSREALLIFFFKQLITWIVGHVVVEFGLIEYPVDIFQYASKTSFTFEFYVYPAICVIFNLHYPQKKRIPQQLLYYFYYCTVMTLIEVLCEIYTDIVVYRNWEWYTTWITLFITFFMSRQFYLWFFKPYKKAADHKQMQTI